MVFFVTYSWTRAEERHKLTASPEFCWAMIPPTMKRVLTCSTCLEQELRQISICCCLVITTSKESDLELHLSGSPQTSELAHGSADRPSEYTRKLRSVLQWVQFVVTYASAVPARKFGFVQSRFENANSQGGGPRAKSGNPNSSRGAYLAREWVPCTGFYLHC